MNNYRKGTQMSSEVAQICLNRLERRAGGILVAEMGYRHR